MRTHAFCWRSGLVKFGRVIPAGTRLIARDLTRKQRQSLEMKCRLSYDGKSLLVPGVPEAATDFDAEKAVERFVKWAVAGSPLTARDLRQARAAMERSLTSSQNGGKQDAGASHA